MESSTFVEAVLARLEATAEDFWDNLTEEEKPIVRRAASRSAELAESMVVDPGNREAYQQDLNHIANTLLSETAVGLKRAEKQIRVAIGQTIRDVAAFFLDALV